MGDKSANIVEGGPDVLALLAITNDVRFPTAEIVDLTWGGAKLDVSGSHVVGVGGRTTITMLSGDDTATFALVAPDLDAALSSPVYFPPQAQALTATHDNTAIDSVTLTRIDKAPRPRVTIEPASNRVSEGEGAEMKLRVTPRVGVAFAVNIEISDPGSALASTPATIQNFAQDQIGRGINLTTSDNMAQDPTRTVTVEVKPNTDYPWYSPGDPSTATLTVLDNDTPPPAPPGFKAKGENGQATLTWNAPPASSGGEQPIQRYEVRWKETAANAYTVMWTSVGTARIYTVESLTNKTPYTFQVRAENVAGYGPSSTTTATPSEVSVPTVVQNVQARGGIRHASLSWEPPESDGNSPIVRYEYRRDIIYRWESAGLNLELELAQEATGTYDVQVRAVNAIGPGPASEAIRIHVNPTDRAAPSEPQYLYVDADDSSEARLTWFPPISGGNSPITGYRIEVCTAQCDDDASWSSLVADTGNTDTGWNHTGLTPGVIRQNHYRVRAINTAQGAGDATRSATLPPTIVDRVEARGIDPNTIDLRIVIASSPDGLPLYVRYLDNEDWKSGDWSSVKHTQIPLTRKGHITPLPLLEDLEPSTIYRIEIDRVETFDSPQRIVTSAGTPRAGSGSLLTSSYANEGAGIDIDVNGDGAADENPQVRLAIGESGSYRLRLKPCEGQRSVYTEPVQSPAGALGVVPVTRTPSQLELECAGTEPSAWQTVNVAAIALDDYPTGRRVSALLAMPFDIVYSHNVYTNSDTGHGNSLVSSGTGKTRVTVSANASATLPTPTGLSLSAGGPRTLTLGWTAVIGAQAYEMQWQSGGGPYSTSPTQNRVRRWGTLTGMTLTFPQTVTWDFKARVRAYSASGVSAWSEMRRSASATPSLFVDDTETHEGPDAKMRFPVRLDPAASWSVRVAYATVNDTASAGSDYTATWGELIFAAGETEMTVEVPVLDDAQADSGERFKLRLSEPPHRSLDARIGRREGYGIIRNTEELGARFARSRFASTSHAGAGSQAQVAVAFSEAVAAFAKTTPSVTVTGGSVASVRRHAEAALTHAWMFFIEPSGTESVTFTLVADAACDAGGICTEDGRVLKEVPGARTLPGPDEAPVIDDAEIFTVAENTTHVARLGAGDADTAVESLTWSIPDGAAGGADGAAFTITGDGVLAFAAAKDFEAPDDAGADGVYEVTVRVGDGTSDSEAALRVRVSDVDDTAPALTSAEIDADALTLTFDEALDTTAKPATSTFAVTVNEETRTVESVTLADRKVTLTLASAVVSAETVSVAYAAPADPDARRLRDAAGNAAGDIAERTVTNATPVPGNEPPTGAPTISGTAQVDETLTVSVDGIDDPDGMGEGGFSYRWLVNDRSTESEIAGATAATYTPVAADTGKTLRVEAIFTDARGTRETVVSVPTVPVAAAIPKVSIAATRAHTPEGTDAAFTLTRVGDIAAALTVAVSVEESGTVLGTPLPASATFAAGASTTTLAVPTDDDATREIDGTVTVRVASGTGYRLAASGTSASVTVLDDDPPEGTPGPATDVTVWSADITVVDYENGSIGAGSAALISNEGGTAGLEGKWLWYRTPDRKLYLSFTEGVADADGLTLHAGGVALVFPEGSSENASFTWDDVDVDWTDGQIVSVRIARASPVPVSADATLASLTISGATLEPAFSATGGLYTATLAQETEQITVSATKAQDDAAVSYTPATDADSALAGHQIAVPVGDTVVKATVTAPDGVTTREYRVVVTRPAPAITVAFAAAAHTASEGAKAASVAVTLDAEPGATITIPLVATPGGGASAGDYSAPPSVTFESGGGLTQTITVSAAIDADEESGEHVVLGFGTLPDGVVAGDTAETTVALVEWTNTAPTGRPAIDGRVRVGDLLTALAERIADADGLTGAAFAWQWVVNDAGGDSDIEGAGASTYTPVADDAGKRLKVRATFTDDAGTQESVLSAASAVVAAAPSVPEVSIATATSPVTEGTDAVFTVSRIGPAADALTVTVAVTETGAMLAGSAPTAVAFAADAATSALTVATADDEAVEEPSTLTAALVAADGYTVVAGDAAATVRVDDDDAAPVVTTESPLTVTENTTAVTRLEATDADTEAEDLTWRVSGGDDAGEFRLTEAGVLSFYRAPDFEAPDDADEDGTWEVKVRVSDGANHTEAELQVQVTDVDDVAPALAGATVNATALTLTFDEALDGASAPPATAFAVTVGDAARSVDQVSLGETTATLTLASAVTSSETVTVSYTVPSGASAAPLADSSGNAVAAFSDQAVTNETTAPDNTAAMGVPQITGTPRVGETLTAATGAIADADGLEGVTFAYQWIANDGAADSDIADARAPTYTVAPADVGKTLKVQVTFTDDAGNAEEATSEATGAVTATVPGAPGDVRAETPAGADGALAVSWSAPASDGAATITAYRVQWKSGTESYDTTPESRRRAEGTDLYYTITGLTNGTEYTIRVLATNAAGTGTAGEVSATPRDRIAPALSSATVNGATLTLGFDEALDENSPPAASAFAVAVAGTARDADSVTITGSAAVLTLASAVASEEIVTVSYTVPTGANARPIADSAGNPAPALSGEAVTNETQALTARFEAAPASHDGASAFEVKLRFSEEIAMGFRTMRYDALEVSEATVTGAQRLAPPSNMGWKLTIEPTRDEAVTIAVPANLACTETGAICTLDGRALSKRVELAIPGPTAASVPGAPADSQAATPSGSDGVLAVTWSAPASDGGAAITAYRVAWKSGSLDYDTTARSKRQAEVSERTYTIAGLGNGVEYTIRVRAVNDAGAGAAAEVTGTPRDRAAPVFSAATVNGATLTLTFDETLDEDSAPAAEAFAVAVDDTARGVDAVAVTGSAVGLTLASAVTRDETVTVSYTVPSAADAARIADGAGNAAGALTSVAVTNETGATVADAPPEVSIAAARLPVTEGSDAVFTLHRTGDTAAALTVAVRVSQAGAVLGANTPSQATFAAEAAQATLSVATDDDATAEADGHVTASVGAGTGYTVAAGAATARVDVLDNDRSAMTQTLLWSADMTVVDYGTGAIGAARADLFSNVESQDGLEAKELWYYTPTRKLRLKFKEALDDVTGLTLEVSDVSLALAEESGGSPSFTWEDVDVEWSDGDTVAVRLTRTSEAEPPSAGVSVADAQVQEAAGAVLAFRVTLDAEQTAAVSVRYATADGTAAAGADYVAASGAVRFEAGETAQTVRVAVLDDGHDDPSETLVLRLSAPFGARLADGEATGTIANSDPVPQAWLARFGRTVAGHVTDAIAGRFEAAGAGSQVVLGGQPLSPASDAALAPGAGAPAAAWDGWPGADGVRAVTGRELLLGSSLLLAGGDAEGRTAWAAWGRAAASQFDGAADGVALDGDVITFMLGADVAWSRWLAGAALAHSIGGGGYGDQGAAAGAAGSGGGTLAVTLTSIHPYLRVQASERISLWGVLGYGAGELTLTPDTAGSPQSAKAGTQMGMAAAGARGELVSAGDTGGFGLAALADAQLVQVSSGAGIGLAATQAATSRLRLVLESGYRVDLGGGRALTPALEVGARYDGGDAETGAGIEVGGALGFADAKLGLTVQASVRGLLAHEDADYAEWGAAGTIRFAPGGGAGLGPSLSVSSSWGAVSGGAERLWEAGDARGLAPDQDFAPAGSLEAEAGWGLAAFGGRGLMTPVAGLAISAAGERTWRTGVRWTLGPDLAFGFEGTMHEAAGGGAAEPGIEFQATARW